MVAPSLLDNLSSFACAVTPSGEFRPPPHLRAPGGASHSMRDAMLLRRSGAHPSPLSHVCCSVTPVWPRVMVSPSLRDKRLNQAALSSPANVLFKGFVLYFSLGWLVQASFLSLCCSSTCKSCIKTRDASRGKETGRIIWCNEMGRLRSSELLLSRQSTSGRRCRSLRLQQPCSCGGGAQLVVRRAGISRETRGDKTHFVLWMRYLE